MRLLKGFLLLAILAGSSCEAKPGSAPKTLSKARATVSVDGPEVIAASQFALAELRRYCDYCNDELKEVYQGLEIKSLTSAETMPTSLTDGTMFFLDMTLESKIAYEGKTTDAQTIIVFQNKDRSYSGMSVERSPFLAM